MFSSGFTLIELMIAVLVAAIITIVAVPVYQDSVTKSRRSDAKVLLTTTAQLMERFYTENQRYNTGGTSATCGITLPIESTPRDDHTPGYYVIAAGAAGCTASATTFTLTAAPQGVQAADSGCGSFTLTNAGARGVTGTLAATSCW